jgi:peptidyl-prolyl cis-trans isomerase SurA
MKKFYISVLLSMFARFAFCQTLFTFGNEGVSKEEFLKAYNKNKTPVDDREKSLREYLDLYMKFKLKVRSAPELKLDTLPQLQYEIQNFRGQVEDSYMNDEQGMNELVDEAFLRSQKDLHVLHFFVALDGKMLPADTLRAYKAMNEVYEELTAGKDDYEELTTEIGEKYMPIKGSDLGYITAFTLPYEYENIIYKLKLGQSSKPYRSRNGIHVFRLIDERKNIGKWKIAQILLAFPPDDSGGYFSVIKRRADSVYAMLQTGANFAELAKLVSDDKLTYLTGGEMPEFSTGKYEMPYEKEVIKLEKDGDISKPFFTKFGFHILKRLGNTPAPSDKADGTFLFDLKQKITQDPRVNAAKEKFTKEVIKRIGYKKNMAVSEAEIFKYADSISANPTPERTRIFPISNKILYSFAKGNIKGSDWLNFVKEYKGSGELYQGETNAALLQKYINITALEYYKKNLEQYNSDFKYQMKEFKEGNMLFEIMERNVWSKASNDLEGLQKVYNQNKSKYLWAASADILLFNCKDAKAATAANTALQQGKDWKKIAEESEMAVQSDSGRYELNQIAIPAGSPVPPGVISPIVVNNTDGSASFVKILKLYPDKQQRSFEEAKGLVINDYQIVVEDKWIAELKKKHPVKVDEKVFQQLLK